MRDKDPPLRTLPGEPIDYSRGFGIAILVYAGHPSCPEPIGIREFTRLIPSTPQGGMAAVTAMVCSDWMRELEGLFLGLGVVNSLCRACFGYRRKARP